MFRISQSQMALLRARQLERSRMRILSYLRETAPDVTGKHDDKSLYALIRSFETSGNELGLRSERAHAKWAYLMLMTNGEFNSPPVRAVLTDPDQCSSDLALDRIMLAMIELEAAEFERAG